MIEPQDAAVQAGYETRLERLIYLAESGADRGLQKEVLGYRKPTAEEYRAWLSQVAGDGDGDLDALLDRAAESGEIAREIWRGSPWAAANGGNAPLAWAVRTGVVALPKIGSGGSNSLVIEATEEADDLPPDEEELP